MPGPSIARRLLAPLLLLASALVATPALAQGLDVFSGGGDPLGGELAVREDVTRTLRISYESALAEQVRKVLALVRDGGHAPDLSADVDGSRAAFLATVGTTLLELEGDGALTLAEIGRAIPPIRERHLERFRDVAEAKVRGHAAPPIREGFGSSREHALAMTRYVALTRNSPGAWASVLLAVLGGAAFAGIIASALERLGRHLVRRDRAILASSISSVHAPLMLGAGTAGLFVGLGFLWLPTGVDTTLRAFLTTLIAAFAFWAVWRLCDELVGPLARTTSRVLGHDIGAQGRLIVRRVLRVLVLVAALFVLVRVVLDASVTGLAAGLGAVGVGAWFLARGFVENVAASFTLFGDGVFSVGDTVVHEGEWGVIEDIGFRSTRCRTFDGHMLHIPNRTLVDETIRNVSARPFIRSRFRLSLVHDTPPARIEEAMDIVRSVIESEGDAIDRAEGVNVVFDAIGDYDLQLLVQYCTASDDYWTGKAVIGAVNVGIRRRFEEAGIAFAYPTRTTRLEHGAGASPELPAVRASGVSDGQRAERGDPDPGAFARPTRHDGFDEAA